MENLLPRLAALRRFLDVINAQQASAEAGHLWGSEPLSGGALPASCQLAQIVFDVRRGGPCVEAKG